MNGSPRQFTVQLNRVRGANAAWGLIALVVRQLALLPDFDYKRTLAISSVGSLKSLLISVSAKNALVLRHGKYQEAAKCLYEFAEAKDFRTCRVPAADLALLQTELKAKNRYLPKALRKIGNKRLAYFVYAEVFPPEP